MRPDEPGTPLIVSGRVLDGHGQPLEGAKLDIYHAANNGNYSALYDDGVPTYNLRGHLFTDADGRYTYTTITPVASADPSTMEVDGVVQAVAALGGSLHRPAHIHYEVHQPGHHHPERDAGMTPRTRPPGRWPGSTPPFTTPTIAANTTPSATTPRREPSPCSDTAAAHPPNQDPLPTPWRPAGTSSAPGHGPALDAGAEAPWPARSMAL
ncbi:hypothetical protein ABZ192_19445 [Streptomyces sp. NPDC006235]|uniref:dioxygenase family protein n=1 Tax=Streptomyces sp. NPDC006235 TaxID=3156736 RepID=UPI0033AD61B5